MNTLRRYPIDYADYGIYNNPPTDYAPATAPDNPFLTNFPSPNNPNTIAAMGRKLPRYNPGLEAVYNRMMSTPVAPNIGGEILKNLLGAYVGANLGQAKQDYATLESERQRQQKLEDEKALLDYRAKLDQAATEQKAGIERTQLLTDPNKYTLSEQVLGNIRGFENALQQGGIAAAQDDTQFRMRGLQNILAGGGVTPYRETSFKEIDVPLANNMIQKKTSIDGGLTWKDSGVPFHRPASSSGSPTNANQWRDDYMDALKSISQKDLSGIITDPNFKDALQLGSKYKGIDPYNAAVKTYDEVKRNKDINAGKVYYNQSQDKERAKKDLREMGWTDSQINEVTGGTISNKSGGNITIPDNITKTSQAKDYLMKQHKMSEQQAIDWIRKNQ